MFLNFLCIGLGGFTGACLRAMTGIIIAKAGILASFPLATLLVNITGSFMIGFLLSIPFVTENPNNIEQAKKDGEAKRTKNDVFYLTLAMAKREGKITVDNAREIFKATFGDELNFDNLKDVLFVGDGTYLLFDDKYIEIRPSGTDAKTKAYGGGEDLNAISEYARILGNYSGDRTELHRELISEEFYNNSKEIIGYISTFFKTLTTFS